MVITVAGDAVVNCSARPLEGKVLMLEGQLLPIHIHWLIDLF